VLLPRRRAHPLALRFPAEEPPRERGVCFPARRFPPEQLLGDLRVTFSWGMNGTSVLAGETLPGQLTRGGGRRTPGTTSGARAPLLGGGRTRKAVPLAAACVLSCQISALSCSRAPVRNILMFWKRKLDPSDPVTAAWPVAKPPCLMRTEPGALHPRGAGGGWVAVLRRRRGVGGLGVPLPFQPCAGDASWRAETAGG